MMLMTYQPQLVYPIAGIVVNGMINSVIINGPVWTRDLFETALTYSTQPDHIHAHAIAKKFAR